MNYNIPFRWGLVGTSVGTLVAILKSTKLFCIWNSIYRIAFIVFILTCMIERVIFINQNHPNTRKGL